MKKEPKAKYKSAQGFSLLELAIVMMITGILLTAGTQMFTLSMKQVRYNQTVENMRMLKEAMNEFYAIRGRYPCPADPTLDPGDADYGVELCREISAPRNCPANMPCPDEGRDADDDGNPDAIMVGAFPFQTVVDAISVVKFRARHAFDGYDMKITYAVSEHMADPGKNSFTRRAKPTFGALSIQDENHVELTDPPASAHYVLISHGENMKGAYDRQGNMSGSCLMTSINPSDPPVEAPQGLVSSDIDLEVDNCQRTRNNVFIKAVQSFVPGRSYYDDIVFYEVAEPEKLWKKITDTTTPGEFYVVNTNQGNVGVGLQNPAEKLHVDGNISAERRVVSAAYCQQDGSECFNPELITSETGISCPEGQVAVGLHDPDPSDDGKVGGDANDAQLVCESVFTALPTLDDNSGSLTCPAGQYITSITFNANGTSTMHCSPLL